MRTAVAVLICTAAWAVNASPALSQDAAETATITAGTAAPTARSERAVGSAVSGGIGRIANTIRSGGTSRRSTRRNSVNSAAVIGTGDPLEGSDAPVQELDSGASLRTTGGLRPSPRNRCEAECEGQQTEPDTPEQ